MSNGTPNHEWDRCDRCGNTLSREELEQARCLICEKIHHDCSCDLEEV